MACTAAIGPLLRSSCGEITTSRRVRRQCDLKSSDGWNPVLFRRQHNSGCLVRAQLIRGKHSQGQLRPLAGQSLRLSEHPGPKSLRRQENKGRVRAELATSEPSQALETSVDSGELVKSLDRFPDERLQTVAHPSSTPLLFLDHIQFQWKKLQESAPDLVDLPLPPDIALQTSAKGKCGARVENWAFSSDKMRRVRMTYFYSGDGGQAYNCLVYPDTRFDVPLLGVDLICLGKDRILYVIDFQPLQMSEEYLEKYTAILAPIHEQYLDLIGHMSAKHFDEAQFFSKRMLFVRTSDTDLFKAPHGRLFCALEEYLAAYHEVLDHAVPDTSADARRAVKAAQDAYDVYSEKRDPAIGLFRSYFGNEWAESFTKDFLFPGSRGSEHEGAEK